MGSELKLKGFDSAVSAREEDHLNRWPVAQEIYTLAVTGPRDWSVRIAIYGEWGSGKTTILNFIEIMARQDNHIVIRFNPWQYSVQSELWQAFVLAVYEELKTHIGNVPGSKKTKAKRWIKRIVDDGGKILTDAAGAVKKEAGQVMDFGLNMVKRSLIFSKEDLKDFSEILGERRIIILIDDLDRVEPKFVPEILFAIKEILDLPGYAFICAFDPEVVGVVLGKYHPGFGDGLKFLEKIIDYPRWLLPPSENGMKALAHADIKRYCPYVPLADIDENIRFLPKNPRILRQYIRLLSLLKNQIDRHYEHELIWSIIVATNLMKILYPQIAQRFFENEKIWSEISGAFRFNLEKEEKAKVESLIKNNLDIVVAALKVDLRPDDEKRIIDILKHVAKQITFRTGGHEAVAYQIRLTEAPSAVTWKEYDQFIGKWKDSATARNIDKWILEHSLKVGRSEDNVYTEMLTATIQRRNGSLNCAADEKLKSGMKEQVRIADELLTLLGQLIFDCGHFNSETKRFGNDKLKEVINSLMKDMGLLSREYKALKKKEIAFLFKLIREWVGDVEPIIIVLKPLRMPAVLQNTPVQILREKLCAKVMPVFAKQILDRFRVSNFEDWLWTQEAYNYQAKKIFLQVNGPLWKGLRKQAINILSEATSKIDIQLNACEILNRFDYMFRKEIDFDETKAAENLLKNKQICKALWNAAISRPLNIYLLVGLCNIPDKVKAYSIELKVPSWFRRDIENLKNRRNIEAEITPT
jgi:hypothetical protein